MSTVEKPTLSEEVKEAAHAASATTTKALEALERKAIDGGYAVTKALFNEKTADAGTKVLNAAAARDIGGFVVAKKEEISSGIEALGQKFNNAEHAAIATMFNEKTADAVTKAKEANWNNDWNGVERAMKEEFTFAKEAIGQDLQDIAHKVSGMVGHAQPVSGAPHEVSTAASAAKRTAPDIRKH